MIFPEKATDEERAIDWQKITEISDADFGFDTPKEKTGKIKFCVRILLFNDQGELCVVKSEKHKYMQLPGGKLEKGEGIIDALRRETEEETGYLIDNIEPMGYTVENRGDMRSKHDFDQAISYVFKASPAKEVGTKYMEDEIAEGFEPVWMSLDEIIVELEKNEGRVENYGGCFANRRDLLVAKYFKAIKNGAR